MNYHIDTGLIIQEFKKDCECPLCSIQKIAEEQFLHEFLNDSVMDVNSRAKVNDLGFCKAHFDQLFHRQNKLSLALQIYSRMLTVKKDITPAITPKQAKKQAEKIDKHSSTCIVCDLLNESMIKYYKTVAQLFEREQSFRDILSNGKGFCLEHYSMLLKYSRYAGGKTKEYLRILPRIMERGIDRLQNDLQRFCKKHDYRYANMPLGTAEFAIQNMGIKLYGEKHE